MSTSGESTAVMPAPTEPDVSVEAETSAHTPGAGAQSSAATAGTSTQQGNDSSAREPVSPNVIISTLVGLFVAMAGMVSTLLVLQFNSLGDRIDAQGAELRTEIGELRTEMQAGFREVNATLLDHTERLARLETAGGLTE